MIALPTEVLGNIFAFVDFDDLARVQCVCRRWHEVAGSDKTLWQVYGSLDDPLPQAFDRRKVEALLRRNGNRFRSFHIWINDDNLCTLEDFEWILQTLPRWSPQSLGLAFGMTATRVTDARHRIDGYSFRPEIDEAWWDMDPDSVHLSPSGLEELQGQLFGAIDACTSLSSLRFEAPYMEIEGSPGVFASTASTSIRRTPYVDLIINHADASDGIVTAACDNLLTQCKTLTLSLDIMHRAAVWKVLDQCKASIERLDVPVLWAHANDGSLAATDWQETVCMPNLVYFASEPATVSQYVDRDGRDTVPSSQVVQIPLLDCPKLRHVTINCFVPRTLIASLMTSSIETLTFALTFSLHPALYDIVGDTDVLETCLFTIGYFIDYLKNCTSLSSLRLIAGSHAIDSSSRKLNVEGILEELARFPSIPISNLTIWGSQFLSLGALSEVVGRRVNDEVLQPITYLDVQDSELRMDGYDDLANDGDGRDEQVRHDDHLDNEVGLSRFAYWSGARFKLYADLCESVPHVFINSETDEKEAVREEWLRRGWENGRGPSLPGDRL